MHVKSTAAAVLVAAIGMPVAPAVARTNTRTRTKRQLNAAVTKALKESGSALEKAADALAKAGRLNTSERSLRATVSHQGSSLSSVISSVNQLSSSVSSLNGAVDTLTSGLSSANSTITSAVKTIDGSLSTLTTGLSTATAGLSTLGAEVNDPNTGLGQVDNGVVELYVTPAGGSPTAQPPLFAPNLSLVRGNGSSVSGTFPVQCGAATCTLSMYAQDDSNKPQPASGDVAADVGASVTVTAINPAGGPPDNELFQDAGVTPDNASIGNNPVVAIPTRAALTDSYPGPSGAASVQVPLQSILTMSGNTLTVPGGLYLVTASVNFLKVTS